MDLEKRIARLDDTLSNHPTERWFRAIAEEAGEVVGAYNKMEYGPGHHKFKSPQDLLEEMGQLVGCVLVAARRIGFFSADVLEAADEFMDSKAREIVARRAGMKV